MTTISDPSIIILAESADLHAQSVKHEVQNHFSVVCYIIDTAEFPAKLTLEYELTDDLYARIFIPEENITVNYQSMIGIWRRRIRNCEISSELTRDSDRELSRRDSRSALNGFLFNLGSTSSTVINNPIGEAAGLNKSYQLTTAKKVGLAVPQTLITNNPNSVRDFYNQLSSCKKSLIYKGYNSPTNGITTTKIFKEEDLERVDSLCYAPGIFQEYIEGRNLRVTVVGNNVFSAEVLVSIPEAERDWRIEFNSKVVSYGLDNASQDLIRRLMSALKLTYGAIDLKLRPTGEIVFLEVNPWGQFLFVEIQTGLPISFHLAQTLVKGLSKKPS